MLDKLRRPAITLRRLSVSEIEYTGPSIRLDKALSLGYAIQFCNYLIEALQELNNVIFSYQGY